MVWDITRSGFTPPPKLARLGWQRIRLHGGVRTCGGEPETGKPMKAALLARLKRLEEVKATESVPPAEFQVGFVKKLPAEYAGDRHIVTVGRDPDGTYRWEERPGPEPNQGKRNSVPPFKVVIASAEDEPPAPGAAEIDADITS